MGNAIRRRTTYTLSQDGMEFELSFEPADETASVSFGKRKKTAEVRYLVYDGAAGGISDYWKEFENGKFYCADPRSAWYKDLDAEAIEELRKENPGRVFLINKFEHGQVMFYRSGSAAGYPYNCPWDNSRGYAIFIAPEDATDPAGYCDSIMKEFSDWCNGEIYGCVLDKYERGVGGSWHLVDSDACWGYIGSEWALQALKTFPN